MKLVFLGPPGAGKGTMASRTKELLNIPHISTGQLFRENIGKGTALGLRVKAALEKGDLVQDDVTIAMIEDRLAHNDAKGGFILDGFPRTIPQAKALAGLGEPDCVINYVCSDEELIRRLTGRRMCPVCNRAYHIEFMPPKVQGRCDADGAELIIRGDDRLEAVKNRLKVYTKLTEPLISYYNNSGLSKDIDASLPPDDVFEELKAALRY